MDARGLTTVTDFFVICTAQSARQIRALSDHLDTTLRQHRCRVWHTEGTASVASAGGPNQARGWILMDFGDIVVHLFDQDARVFYGLERLWADAPRLDSHHGPPPPTRAGRVVVSAGM